MSCCGDREKGPPEQKQRWEFIELSDFRCTSFLTYLAYGWLWFMGGVGVAVYAVDTFTAVNLLIFDRWSSQVKPYIPFKYSKWIFAACIFLSWALCIYEWIRAIRVIKRDGVAASYMDPVAASLQSMRSRGFKRFLVYTELTKSKKGTDYVAFFVYFAFQSAIRVVLAEGPRQGVNAITLYAVMQADLINGGQTTDGHSHIQQFFINIGAIADNNYEQAAIYASMLFTLVIWVFSALCLILAGVLYLVFLWHYIPQRDGRLRIYCRRKIDRRLEKIVAHKIEAAIEDEAKKREKAEKKAELKRQKTGELPPPPGPFQLSRAPTLPDLGDDAVLKKDDMVSLSRQDTKSTVSTLPPYSARPPGGFDGMERQPSLPDLNFDRPGMPSRTATQASARSKASFESDAPLLPNAGFAGYDGRVPSPAPTYYSRKPSTSSFNPPIPGRMNTQSTQASQRSFTPVSATTPRPPPGQRFPVRSNTAMSFDEPMSAVSDISPIENRSQTPMAAPPRSNTPDAFRPGPRRQGSEVSYFSRPVAAATPPPMPRQPTLDSINPPLRGTTPGPRHQAQDSDVSYFSRPVAAPTPPPMPRQPTLDSINPPLRGTTPAPRHQAQNSFGRPFTPAYAPTNHPTPPPNSYEMTSQPPSNVYVPFNPGLHSSAKTPIQDGARRNITLATATAQPNNGDYFGLAPPQRSVTSSADDRALSSYGSILDDYGASTPLETHEQRPMLRSPPTARGTPPPRSYTASPRGW